jgi:hypothetical protein
MAMADALMSLASSGLYAAKWSQKIESEVVRPLGIGVIHPDPFVVAQWDLDQFVSVAAFKRMRARWKKPQATPEDFATALERTGPPATAQRLCEAAELI